MRAALLVTICTFAAASGCRCSEPQAESSWYRATLSKGGAPEIPFFLSLPSSGGQRAIVTTGKQWFSGEHTWDGDQLTLEFPLYRTKIVARRGAQGVLLGRFESASRAWGNASLDFKATAIPQPLGELRFPSDSAGSVPDLAGVWRVKLADGGSGKLELERGEGSAVTATLVLSSGNSVYLAGNATDRKLQLSGFDGTSPYLLTADFEPEQGTLRGEWLAGQDLSWREGLEAERASDDFTLPPPIQVSSPDRKLKLPELEEEPYRGKPVVLQLVASWCVHCRNAAPFYRELYDRYKGSGLQMLSLAYELTPDKLHNQRQAEELRERYQLDWDVVARHGTLDEFWSLVPEGLTGREIPELPVTILLDAQRTVRAIHAGFVGPESEEQHERLKSQIEVAVQSMLGPS